MESRRTQPLRAEFEWSTQAWKYNRKREGVGGLVIYSRFDGSFAVWDPRAKLSTEGDLVGRNGVIKIHASQVWDGVQSPGDNGRGNWICNGLLIDWINWQSGGDKRTQRFDALVSCLAALSPSQTEPLRPGRPQRRFAVRFAAEIPTLALPYGEVPVQLVSAGIQRALALAYVLVWSWFEHLAIAADTRSRPQSRVVLVVDEVKAHLHPEEMAKDNQRCLDRSCNKSK